MIRLAVDGVAVDATRLELHYQDDPYPAGSKYNLTVIDSDLARVVTNGFSEPHEQPLSAARSISLFNLLRLYVSQHCGRRFPPLFWANTVDAITIASDSVTITGICSPHMGDRDVEPESGEQNAASSNAKAAATVTRGR